MVTIDDFRLMNDSQNKKMYLINLSGQPPRRGLGGIVY